MIHKVVCMGDSLTYGYLTEHNFEEYLLADLAGDWTVTNKGHSGHTTGQMLDRFADDVVALAPGAVTIWGGINDILQGDSTSTIESNLAAMYLAAHNAGIKVIALTISPFYDYAWNQGRQDKLDAVNAWIEALPSNVDYVVDAWTVLVDPNVTNTLLPAYSYGDGLHIIAAGDEAIATAIYNLNIWADAPSYARSTIANAIDWTDSEMLLGPLQMIAWSCAGAAGEPGAPTYIPTLMMMGMGN
jgi:lysophospholipase L1-like esterase